MDADAAMPDDPEVLKRMIRELLASLKGTRQELEGVQRRLDQLLRRLYGPKSEAFRPDQPTLFAIPGEPEPATPPTSDAPVSPTSNPKAKRGHGRRRQPDHLPRERVVHDLPDAEKTCPYSYCDVIVERFEKFSGKKAERVPADGISSVPAAPVSPTLATVADDPGEGGKLQTRRGARVGAS